jgi:protein phosphatase
MGVWEKNYLNLEIVVGAAIVAALILLLIRKLRRLRRGTRYHPPKPTPVLPREASVLRHRVGALTNVGKVRSTNEDSILTMELRSSFESKSTSSILCAVADGVGGSQKGEMASKLALQTLAEKVPGLMIGSGRADPAGALKSAVDTANQAVVKFGMGHSESEGMATTIVASVLDGRTAYVAHAGDSRAYLINRGEIKQLTKDDSQVQEWVDAGKITADQARHYPGRNIITRALGAATDIEIAVSSFSLAPGDRILLCSDGLWEPLTDTEIQKIVLESSNPQSACEKLVSLANERGGKDNVSVVIVEMQSGEMGTIA